MKLLLLLGSGVSLPSEMPCVKQITERILHGCWEFKWPHFLPGKAGEARCEITKKCQTLLRCLGEWASRSRREYQFGELTDAYDFNYEELYWFVDQLQRNDERNNPLLLPAERQLRDELNAKGILLPTADEFLLHDVREQSIDLIESVVWCELSRPLPPVGLDLVRDLVRHWAGELTIATLNHDCLVERVLSGENIIDGFVDAQDTLPRYFDQQQLLRRSKRAKLLKLHGSVDWINIYGRITIRQEHPADEPDNPIPILLCGSHNKREQYGVGIFREIMYIFDHELLKTDVIVVSGYGWRDEGINLRLYHWLRGAPDRTIILLYEDIQDPEVFWSRRTLYDLWKKEGKIVCVREWLENTSLEELKSAVQSSAAGYRLPCP